MAKRKSHSTGWAACKRALADWPAKGMLELLRELHALTPENRTFLQARLLDGDAAVATTAAVEKRLRALTTVAAVYNGRFRHGDLKRVVDQFAKGTTDAALVVRVLIYDLEESCSTLHGVGDSRPLVDHIYAVMTRLDKLRPALTPPQRSTAADRLTDLAREYHDHFGYGVSDELTAMAAEWTRNASEARSPDAAPAKPAPDF